jgi:hypothetical protein
MAVNSVLEECGHGLFVTILVPAQRGRRKPCKSLVIPRLQIEISNLGPVDMKLENKTVL